MFRSLATSSFALIVGAAPVLAEVSPVQVWENLDSYYSEMGYDVSVGNRDEAGSTLTLSEVKMTSKGATEEVTITIPKLTLQETGDARVRTVIEGDVMANMISRIEGQDDVNMSATIALPSNEMLSSGETDDMLHELTYPSVAIAARLDVAEDDEAAQMPVNVTLTDVVGEYRSREGDGAESTYDMTMAALDLALAFEDMGATDPEMDGGSGSIEAKAHVDGLTMKGTMIAPTGQFNMADQAHLALQAGLKIDGRMELGAINGDMQFQGVDADGNAQSGAASVTSEGSAIELGMSEAGLTYGGSAQGTAVELTTGELPFPISYAIADASAKVIFPVSRAEEPQPFSLDYNISGLTLADAIWDLFDPQASLPRDPANLSIALEGLASMREDLLDPAFGMRMAEEMAAIEEGAAPPAEMPVPFQPQSVNIKQISLDAVGAKAEVTGELTIPEGSGQPVGNVNGTFSGMNGLLETLSGMGLIPQEQMMGARMMIAMFARPSEDNPDQLQTSLEFREDGSIFANGQQVK